MKYLLVLWLIVIALGIYSKAHPYDSSSPDTGAYLKELQYKQAVIQARTSLQEATQEKINQDSYEDRLERLEDSNWGLLDLDD